MLHRMQQFRGGQVAGPRYVVYGFDRKDRGQNLLPETTGETEAIDIGTYVDFSHCGAFEYPGCDARPEPSGDIIGSCLNRG